LEHGIVASIGIESHTTNHTTHLSIPAAHVVFQNTLGYVSVRPSWGRL